MAVRYGPALPPETRLLAAIDRHTDELGFVVPRWMARHVPWMMLGSQVKHDRAELLGRIIVISDRAEFIHAWRPRRSLADVARVAR